MFEFDRTRIDVLRPRLVDEHLLDRTQPMRRVSARLTAEGKEQLDDLVLEACSERDEIWLARSIEPLLLSRVPANTKSGFRKVPANAAATLADGIWNNLVCRAECLLGIELGCSVEAYRAGHRIEPRPASVGLIGRNFVPSLLLDALRCDAIDPRANRSPVPVGPNSGLSVRALDYQLPELERR